jgi:hypothetical protein
MPLLNTEPNWHSTKFLNFKWCHSLVLLIQNQDKFRPNTTAFIYLQDDIFLPFMPSTGSQFLFIKTYWGMDKNLWNALKLLEVLRSTSKINMCGENSPHLKCPVPLSASFVAAGCHSMFINLVSLWRIIPSSNYEMLNGVRRVACCFP